MFPTDNNFESEFTFENAAGVPLSDELPFHILLLGDWGGESAKNPLSDRRPIVVDRDNFNAVMDSLNIILKLDLYGVDNAQLTLEFHDLDDFHPDALLKNVSLFSDLRETRRRLSDSETFERAAREVRSWFYRIDDSNADNLIESQNNVLHAIEPDTLLDQILSAPNESALPRTSPKVDNSELGKFVSKIVSPHLIKVDENEQSELISAVDDIISELMRKILHHPKFQSLESAWRGLYFLVRRVETDINLKIFILDASKDELADNLKSANNLEDSFLFRVLQSDSSGKFLAEPFSVIGANYSFGLNVDDVAALIRIGKIAFSLKTPFISHLKPEIFGVNDFSELTESAQFLISEDSREFKLWNSLRFIPEAQSIGLSPLRLCARVPYGSATDPVESFSFEEFTENQAHSDYLWFNPCFPLILLLAQSFRESGWEMSNFLQLEINNLPIHYFNDRNETKSKPCAEILMTEKSLMTFVELGLIPLISFRDTDKIRVSKFQSISLSNSKFRADWF